MAGNKKHKFSERENEIAMLAKALAHPARIYLLETISKRKFVSLWELVTITPLAQATISQHIKELLKAGLIEVIQQGPFSNFHTRPEVFGRLEKLLLPIIRKNKR
ncbi:MAG TPA: ArsR family transcriptional regulator [Bacteroidia bacterium]|jgi:DNA-binding transcriptional ArsR family regulator